MFLEFGHKLASISGDNAHLDLWERNFDSALCRERSQECAGSVSIPKRRK